MIKIRWAEPPKHRRMPFVVGGVGIIETFMATDDLGLAYPATLDDSPLDAADEWDETLMGGSE